MKPPAELLHGRLANVRAEGASVARVTMHDLELEVRFDESGSGSTHLTFTEVRVLVPGSWELHLHVVPERAGEKNDIDAGLGTDLVLHDEAFDAAFLVEAGPREVVEALLDADVRRRMWVLHPVGVHTLEPSTRDDGVILRIEKLTWLQEPEVLLGLVELAAEIARRIPEAFGRARRKHAERDYRGGAPVLDAYRDEVARVKALQRRRAEVQIQRTRVAVGVILTFVAIVLSLAALDSCGGL